ncbi:hypothetical protein TREMEDRAFT_61324 [Tremella mesenterica DSM 1558]|uniref:uncharacterized protein n=1 Tax=Tremella mesenterica (strain ATCC 24925 / CBS 8224 / DSM 1558 / NBRC 9311 / NRRL Y-6157 / RJB 2259-6 / UBC 559-6) TaxID=578456 RepID=UPI0003F4A42E|nr:uncharacterized protein TREMEDRAFT_61324 [Tremella mesenterica DSM 1558]EIW70816.1 hypothetical protein TREMEDRAFT_61324 [Tremella mesenterica DSM 1558]
MAELTPPSSNNNTPLRPSDPDSDPPDPPSPTLGNRPPHPLAMSTNYSPQMQDSPPLSSPSGHIDMDTPVGYTGADTPLGSDVEDGERGRMMDVGEGEEGMDLDHVSSRSSQGEKEEKMEVDGMGEEGKG